MESLIPTLFAFVSTQMYCIKENIPFFTNGTKDVSHKVLINLRNSSLGILLHHTLTTNFVSYADSMNPIEELSRMTIYSMMIEFSLYWIHRYMHENKWLYKHVHKEHHLETVPSPSDAYILTLTESTFLLMTYMLPLILGFNITKRGTIVVQTSHLIMSILVHGGLPNINHHMIHHSHFNTNYSGIYPLWDNVFGTRIHDKKTNNVKVNTKPKAKIQNYVKKINNVSLRKKCPMKPIRNLKGKLLSTKAFHSVHI